MNKKLYTKPELSTFIIDNEISLVLMSENTPPPLPESATQVQQPQSSPTQRSNFEDNPFGE